MNEEIAKSFWTSSDDGFSFNDLMGRSGDCLFYGIMRSWRF